MSKHIVLRDIKGRYRILSNKFRSFSTNFEGSFFRNKPQNNFPSSGKFSNLLLHSKYQQFSKSFCTSTICASQNSLKIGCASGFWGDSPSASKFALFNIVHQNKNKM